MHSALPQVVPVVVPRARKVVPIALVGLTQNDELAAGQVEGPYVKRPGLRVY